ncbi:formate/nitrite transporter family protein [Clostridium formicaceticum]|uniref:Nitrite transporter NirC n=1 Tax=Clostridium formicaceticum TaxID=1497 RepID=A0AAC9RIA3_9CLOT|nr:formate/nitrite transporter family protein [Clostridium formicaceticum]AOY76201.1 nitrite transporter NirC [Clostridium formicaceticum]ARE86576.1 Nitrite transporter NirC [Clostridium formicaceticum]
MYGQEINKIASGAAKKKALFQDSKGKYLLSSMLGGIYVGFGILLIFTIGGQLQETNPSIIKLVMGVSFGVALSLVLLAGSDLFTGNTLIMTIGALEKKVSWKDSLNIWLFSFIGNFLGSILLSILYVYSGLSTGSIGEFIITSSQAKTSAAFVELFIRGILCNMLVCLAVWCFFKLKEETAKLIMIFWCLFAFITMGLEHSVANMTLLTTAFMLPQEGTISLVNLLSNLIPVTLGNFIGGGFLIAWVYWHIASIKAKNKEEIKNEVFSRTVLTQGAEK